MTPVERLRAAETRLMEAMEGSRKMREAIPEHERMTFDPMDTMLSKRGFRAVADIADEGIVLAMAGVLGQHAVDHSERDCRWVECEALALADAILGSAG